MTDKNKKNFSERYTDHYERIINSPEYAKDTYARRMTGCLIFPFIFAFMIPAFLAEKFFGISGYITCTIAGVLAITFAILIAKNRAQKKFNDEKRNK